jgi:hypothetical protein
VLGIGKADGTQITYHIPLNGGTRRASRRRWKSLRNGMSTAALTCSTASRAYEQLQPRRRKLDKVLPARRWASPLAQRSPLPYPCFTF